MDDHGEWPVGTYLRRLDDGDRRDLLTLGALRRADRTVLLHAGEMNMHALLVQKGFVKISVPTDGGRESLLAIRVPGDLLGEMAVLNGRPRSATVTACGVAVVRIVPEAQLRRFLAEHPGAAVQLAGMVADRLRWANQRRVDASTYSAATRLARVLVEMAVTYGTRTKDGIEIGIDLTQPELATLIGVSDITVQRALRTLRSAGQVDTGYRRIIVTDLDGLCRKGKVLASAVD